jgi:hypothetical protein
VLRFTLLLVLVAGFILAVNEWAVAEAWKASYHVQTTLLLAISVWVSVRKLLVIQTPSTFTTVYLVSIVMQLLVWLGYVAFVFYSDQEGIKANAVYFLINCLIFITLQVLFLFLKRGR